MCNEVTLRDENGVMKFTFDNRVFNDLFNKGLLSNTTRSTKNFTSGKLEAFTFNTNEALETPLGKLYLFKGDYITISGI